MKKNAVFEDILTTVTRYFIILVVAVVIFICFSGVRFIKSGEVGLVLRFGKLVGDNYEEQVHKPGILFAFPYLIDEVITVPTEQIIEQTVTTHYTEGDMSSLRNNGYVITGDQNIAVIKVSVKYKITDPVKYALNIKDIEKIINASVSNAMVEQAASTAVDDILTSGKDEYGRGILLKSQTKLSNAETGITISTVELTEVSMPSEVRGVYEQVNAATVQAKTMLEEAAQYRETLIPKAEADANALILGAKGEQSKLISEANSDLAEFRGILAEYNINPEVVKTRIYNDKIAEAIARIGKVYIVKEGDSNIIIK